MKNIILAAASFILLSTFASCEKVIDVNLNSSASQYVIIGNVHNGGGPSTVSISKSVDFQQNNDFPTISGATVVITDQTASVADTLIESSPGFYVTHGLAGVEGHTYHLYININGQIFTSTATMPGQVNLDTLYQQPAEFGDGVSIVPVYTDPAGIKNFYHFVEYIDGRETKEVFYRSDRVGDGNTLRVPLNLGTDTSLHVGSTVTVALQSIDSSMYQYYRTLDETIGQNAAAPANPATNITGAKLGYFNVHAVSSKTIVIY